MENLPSHGHITDWTTEGDAAYSCLSIEDNGKQRVTL